MFLCVAQNACAAADCSIWAGIWDITYDNGTKAVWTIDAYDNDPDSEVLLCTAAGTGQLDSGETLPIYIMYLKFTKSYYFAYSAEKPSRDTPAFDLLYDNDLFVSEEACLTGTKRPGTGADDETPDDTQCIAVQLSGTNSYEAAVLRRFRERVLDNSAAGKQLTRFYYTHSDRIAVMLDRHPAACRIARKIIELSTPVLETMLDNE